MRSGRRARSAERDTSCDKFSSLQRYSEFRILSDPDGDGRNEAISMDKRKYTATWVDLGVDRNIERNTN